MCVCIYIIHVYIHVSIYVCIYIHEYINAHTHTHKLMNIYILQAHHAVEAADTRKRVDISRVTVRTPHMTCMYPPPHMT
jgi:hypothetical protein